MSTAVPAPAWPPGPPPMQPPPINWQGFPASAAVAPLLERLGPMMDYALAETKRAGERNAVAFDESRRRKAEQEARAADEYSRAVEESQRQRYQAQQAAQRGDLERQQRGARGANAATQLWSTTPSLSASMQTANGYRSLLPASYYADILSGVA